jgi:predicted site-specific integrase-resolvase
MIETKYYSVQEVADMFKRDPETIRRWHRDGKIKTVQIGEGRIMVSEKEIERITGGLSV